MELLYIALAIGGFIFAFKFGRDAGREETLVEQSNAVEHALEDRESDFYKSTRLHGMYVLPGHKNRWPPNYVIVKHSDLLERLEPDGQELQDSDSEEVQERPFRMEDPEQDQEPSVAQGPLLWPSAALERITGAGPLHRGVAVLRVWEYVENHNLKDSEKQTVINCNEVLEAVVGHSKVSLFSLAKIISPHLSSRE